MMLKLLSARIIQILSLLWALTLLLTAYYNSAESVVKDSGGLNLWVPHPQTTSSKIFPHQSRKWEDIRREDLPNLGKPSIKQDNKTENEIFRTKKNGCLCVKCRRDTNCGKLWHANQPYFGKRIKPSNTTVYERPLHLVVSYCKGDLNFIDDITMGYNVKSIHIISKCGHPVQGAPGGAEIEVLPNVGRCDHSYAYYIANVLEKKLLLANDTQSDSSLVLFFKDNAGARNLHQSGRWNSLENMVEVASSKAGFACGLLPGFVYLHDPIFDMSSHFELKTLKLFNLSGYSSRADYESDAVTFLSKFKNLGEFYEHVLNGEEPIDREIVPICFGGVFATTVRQIKKQKTELWKEIVHSLTRGDNIQEGHFVERMWGMLLSNPLDPYQIEAIKEHADFVLRPGYGKILGAGVESVLGAVVSKISPDDRRVRIERKLMSARRSWFKQNHIKRERGYKRFDFMLIE
eukprot:scaffold1038_cov100-Cylindrotheca_fusiformis.AAC.4